MSLQESTNLHCTRKSPNSEMGPKMKTDLMKGRVASVKRSRSITTV